MSNSLYSLLCIAITRISCTTHIARLFPLSRRIQSSVICTNNALLSQHRRRPLVLNPGWIGRRGAVTNESAAVMARYLPAGQGLTNLWARFLSRGLAWSNSSGVRQLVSAYLLEDIVCDLHDTIEQASSNSTPLTSMPLFERLQGDELRRAQKGPATPWSSGA